MEAKRKRRLRVDWTDGRVVGNELLGEKYRWLKIEPAREVSYKAGQYLILKINEMKQNSYSICSLPGSEILEAIVDVSPAELPKPAGDGSRYVDGLKVGDEVTLAAPFGKFVVDDDKGTKVFLATGSGVSSIFPMVWVASEERENSIRLFWGLRHERNIFWQGRLDELVELRLNFAYEIVLSQPEGEWDGKMGHVTECVGEWLTGFLNGGGAVQEVSFYVCGNGEMIKDVGGMLQGLGVAKEKVHREKYFEGEEESLSDSHS